MFLNGAPINNYWLENFKFSKVVGSSLQRKMSPFLMYSTDIPASVHGMSACALLFTHPWIRCQQTKPSTPMSHIVYKPQLRSVSRSSMHPCPGNWVAIKHAVVYHARASHAFSAGFKCRLCILRSNVITISLRLCVENEKQWSFQLSSSITKWKLRKYVIPLPPK